MDIDIDIDLVDLLDPVLYPLYPSTACPKTMKAPRSNNFKHWSPLVEYYRAAPRSQFDVYVWALVEGPKVWARLPPEKRPEPELCWRHVCGTKPPWKRERVRHSSVRHSSIRSSIAQQHCTYSSIATFSNLPSKLAGSTQTTAIGVVPAGVRCSSKTFFFFLGTPRSEAPEPSRYQGSSRMATGD